MKSKIKLVTCQNCGEPVRGFASERTMRRTWQLSPRAEAALLIPALQALGTAAIVTAGGSLVADFWLPGVEPVKFGALCGVVSLGGVWWEGIRDDAKRVWYELERRFGVDLDGDGVVGEPIPRIPLEPPQPDVWVPHKEPGHKAPHWKRYSIPWTDRREARMVARAVIGWGKPFSRRVLFDMNVLPNDPEHFQKLRKAMIDKGLAEPKANKTTLTDVGIKYLEGCLTDPPTPDAK